MRIEALNFLKRESQVEVTDTFNPIEQSMLARFSDFDYGRRRILSTALITNMALSPELPLSSDPGAPLAAIRRMEKLGYIERIKNPKNSRDLHLLQLSRKGKEVKKALQKHRSLYLKEPIEVSFKVKYPRENN